MTEHARTNPTRRTFLTTSALTAAAAATTAGAQLKAMADEPAVARPAPGTRPVVISSANGVKAIEKAYALLLGGADPLDAVIAAVNIVEDDPNDNSVGYGGLPNEEGIVELDSSVMHGPTHKAGAVAGLRNIKNPSLVARLVLQRTDHVLLVGEGALRFARAHGFKEENLLTEESRKIWLEWKESHSRNDAWLTPEETGFATSQPVAPSPDRASNDKPSGHGSIAKRMGDYFVDEDGILRTYGTINCTAVTARGDVGGVTTTSGLSYKIPGRVGDSPIIGAGLYVDNGVGAGGSTGRGEANLQNCSSFLIVEMMRQGKSPQEACLEALKRIADRTEKRLRDDKGRPKFDLKFYALAKDGRHGGASMWSGAKYAVCDALGARLLDCTPLYERPAGTS